MSSSDGWTATHEGKVSGLREIATNPLFIVSATIIVLGALIATRAATGRIFPARKEKLKPPSDDDPRTTFADVAGLDDAIEELREVRDYLADSERFRSLGAELPRGILLYGPPGCGKTLLARALAGEAGVPFYFVSASSFVERFVGLGAARVRQLFEEAKRQAPSIVFIDELDAIGRARSADVPGEREFDHTLNQLLVELDGYLRAPGVLILGATNRPELIDAALLRPGRFDRRIRIDPPDRAGREVILRLHASNRSFSRQVDWGEVAAQTAGLNGAELAHIVNEAALLAARRHRPRISSEDVDEAVTKVLMGAPSARVMSEEEKRLAAIHEAGHAVLTVLLKDMSPPARITLLPTAGSLERSVWVRSGNRVLTKRELMAQLIVLLGGRSAELNTFGEPSTRAEDDLRHAASLARSMVERWAMTGHYELAGGSTADASRSDTAVRKLVAQAQEAARKILADNDDKLDRMASTLLERETVSGSELETMLWRRASGAVAADSQVS